MPHKFESPTVTQTDHGEKHTHPAYGVMHMTVPRNNYGMTLFGSDIKHSDTVRITISTATLNRNLNRDFIHEDKQLVSFEMSHAQFAQFITSQGNGSGTPITLERAPTEYKLEMIPSIKQIETKNQTFQKEIRETAGKEIREQFEREINRLEAMIESGKLSKKELSDIHKSMKIRMENFSGNMEYVVKSAEEALAKATTDAKIEVESWIEQRFRSIGKNAVDVMMKLESTGKANEQISE